MKSIEHQYARDVLTCIQRMEENNKEAYGRACHDFPAMVLHNGLALTVTFFEGKSDQHKQYLQDLESVLGGIQFRKACFQSSDFAQYRSLTLKALRASKWFKRYAEAILKVQATAESGSEGVS